MSDDDRGNGTTGNPKELLAEIDRLVEPVRQLLYRVQPDDPLKRGTMIAMLALRALREDGEPEDNKNFVTLMLGALCHQCLRAPKMPAEVLVGACSDIFDREAVIMVELTRTSAKLAHDAFKRKAATEGASL